MQYRSEQFFPGMFCWIMLCLRFLYLQKKELKNINPYVAVLTILSAVRGLEFLQRHKKNISATELENDMVTHLLKGIAK